MNNLIISSIVLLVSIVFSQFIQADTLYDGRFDRWVAQAEQGKARAQYKLGNAYLRGNEVDVDLKMAVKWFKAAADQKYAKAEYKLGYLYSLGKGVKKNPRTAFKYLKRSAERGYSPAQFYLGKLYASGEGTTRDYDAAISWMKKAKADNYGPADSELRRIKKQRASSGSQRKAETQVARATKTVARSITKKKSSKKTAKQKKTGKKKSGKKTKAITAESLRNMVSSSLWQEQEKPAEQFPSDVSNCDVEGDKLVCQTIKLSRTTPFAYISYSVKSSIEKFHKNGKFIASYQVNNHFVMPEDPDDPNPSIEDVPPTGLSPRVTMRCKLKNKEIKCITDNFEKRIYQLADTDTYE
ncbi:MAG TPA: sel1 repeat family protein [Gammaproteobacteria bacterium]|nr:sel1 repeat family protein [Gammaproteobacteria bacterium]